MYKAKYRIQRKLQQMLQKKIMTNKLVIVMRKGINLYLDITTSFLHFSITTKYNRHNKNEMKMHMLITINFA